MDYNSNLCKNIRHLLPVKKSWEETNLEVIANSHGYTPCFFGSVRYITEFKPSEKRMVDTLLIKGLDLISKETFIFKVSNLNFFAAININYLIHSGIQDLIKTTFPKWACEDTFQNTDKKIHERFKIFVFDIKTNWERFISEGNRLLGSLEKDNIYTFGDYKGQFDGNTVVLHSNLLCSHVYFMKQQLEYQPHDFIFDEEIDRQTLMKIDEVIPHIKREGAFDIETIFEDANMNPKNSCEVFEKHYFKKINEMRDQHLRLKNKMVPGLQPPPFEKISQKPHQITSISLVLMNKKIPKKPGHHRKRFLVFYDKSISTEELLPIDTSELGIEYARIEFIACDSEFNMLGKFLMTLCNEVDILYVYHAKFDILVLRQRIAYYGFNRRRTGCCHAHDTISQEKGEQLEHLWANYLSECPELFPGKIHIGHEVLQQSYMYYLNNVEKLMESSPSHTTIVTTMSRLNARLGTTKNNNQNLKSVGFGSDVIDLMLVATQPMYEAISGSLNNRAKVIIGKYKKNKIPQKREKMKDVSYDMLDAAYKAGGTRLAECLVYNLIDSQLLIRMVRCLNPMKEYIFRQVSTLNIDYACHTRGTGNFNGFIQSVKSVEISRNKARIDHNSLVASGNLRHHLYTPETIPLRGGFVMAPLTGLAFAQPKQSFEACVDFASLYPSNMCDLNISPETIIDKKNYDKINDFIIYDWSKVPNGFDKYTLVMRVDRSDPENPTVVRNKSDTYNSLKWFLGLRSVHKKQMKTNDPVQREYHNRLQLEMKICANTHYGVSDRTCSLMITTIGQHKIKFVNEQLKEINCNGYVPFPNYGDTDSTMLYTPPIETEENLTFTESELAGVFDHSDALKEYTLSGLTSKMTSYIMNRFKGTDTFISSFLDHIEIALLDDALSKMALTYNGVLYTSYKKEDTWFIKDPVTNKEMDITTPYKVGMVTKLEYENVSSIVCHATKKMVSLTLFNHPHLPI